MIHTVLLAAALLAMGGYSVGPYDTNSYPASTALERALPANEGYELLPAVEGTVTVEGMVLRPGKYAFSSGMTLDDLIGHAGSFRGPVGYEDIRIARNTPDGEVTYRLSWLIHWQRLVLLHPGDTVVARGHLPSP